MVTGTIQRFEGGAVTVNLGKTDGAAAPQRADPRREPPPRRAGPGHRARRPQGRPAGQDHPQPDCHPDFVRRLFELEIPEIADQTIQIRALAREAGYRSKVAVSSLDQKVDAVGACVGVRGTRIKNIVDELGGERIDIVRWNDALQVLIPNALQPAEIEEVLLCNLLGRAIVLVRDDQLSLAIGRRGQNVRLASKLVGWDIEIMTGEELDELIDKAVGQFSALEGCDTDLANRLVEQGILSYDDLSVMEIDDLVNTIEGLDEETATATGRPGRAPRRAGRARRPAPPQGQPAGRAAGGPAGAGGRRGRPRRAPGRRRRPGHRRGGRRGPRVPGRHAEVAELTPGVEAARSRPRPTPTRSTTRPRRRPASEATTDAHDLELADEAGHLRHHGHEVTHPPADGDRRPRDREQFESRAARGDRRRRGLRSRGRGR